MANIAVSRAFGLGSKGKGGPPVLTLPLATSSQPAAGAAGTGSGSVATIANTGLVTITANAAATDTSTAIGLTENLYTLGATPAANTLRNFTLIAPFFFYEASQSGAASVNAVGANYTLIDAGTAGYFAVVSTTSTNGVARVVYLPGIAASAFRMNDYFGEGATSLTAGSFSQPDAGEKGVMADIPRRVIVSFLASFCLVGK